MKTSRLCVVWVGAALAACMLGAGCSSPGGGNVLTKLFGGGQEHTTAPGISLSALDERSKAQEIRIEQLNKKLASAEADLGAICAQLRDTDRKVSDLRQDWAKQAEAQNAHIMQMKAAYGAVLTQEAMAIELIAKAVDAACAELKATIARSVDELKKAPPTPGIIPPLLTPKETTPPPPPPPSVPPPVQ